MKLFSLIPRIKVFIVDMKVFRRGFLCVTVIIYNLNRIASCVIRKFIRFTFSNKQQVLRAFSFIHLITYILSYLLAYSTQLTTYILSLEKKL